MEDKFRRRIKIDLRRRRRKPIAAYFFFVTFLVFLLLIIFKLPPNQALVVQGFKLPIVPIFFVDLYLVLFFLFYFIFNKLQGTLVASFVSFYLLLRYAHLTHPFFLVVTLGLFITLELFFYKRR